MLGLGMSEHSETIAELSFEFAKAVVYLYKELIHYKHEYVMSRQLLRSGTGIGALVREAQHAESKADFIHKLGIAQKECAEPITHNYKYPCFSNTAQTTMPTLTETFSECLVPY